MKLYSDFAPRRTWQIIADAVCLALIGLWVWAGVSVYALVDQLSTFGVQMQDAGGGFRETMTEIGDTLGGIPLIGGGIRAPFDGASDAGGALEEAGRSQQEAVHQLALTLGISIAALPILVILLLWLLPRLRFAYRAGQAKRAVRSHVDLDLLALRALASRDIGSLVDVHPDAAGAWRRSDPAVVRALAALELEAAGVRLAAT